MINRSDNPVEWTLLVDELTEASEHLTSAISQITTDPAYDESALAVHLGHVMAHLNRAWASRNISRELTDSEWEQFREYQPDLRPIA